ncbi:hypothetical protein SUNI508_06719 [Seiridium unicorne]|uniref:Uncharacterized protein n=1 Tax=Seiridium unicorne TaxID=138068 RepID=A0ABR2V108_9PEZI
MAFRIHQWFIFGSGNGVDLNLY